MNGFRLNNTTYHTADEMVPEILQTERRVENRWLSESGMVRVEMSSFWDEVRVAVGRLCRRVGLVGDCSI